jgi:hypothetical protein
MAALISVAFAGAALPAHAEIKNYEFRLVQSTVQAGADRIVTVRLVDKTNGKAVPDAVIFATRLDMTPDGMQEMATKVTPMPGTDPGTYRFKANFSMAGRWALARCQGAGRNRHGREQARCHGRKMIRLGLVGTAIVAAAGVIFLAGSGLRPRPIANSVASATVAAEANAPIYFQDPDGKPLYSLTPKRTADRRNYRAVPAGADVSFDEPEQPAEMKASDRKGDRKIKYYRNPMGLPDTSPAPKKDSMGMDYIPVYEGDDSDDRSVKLSPGKIQRTGARSEPVVRQPIMSLIRVPGTVQEDERRVSVVALRFEGFVESVANVTTGDHVHKGQPLMNVYSPAPPPNISPPSTPAQLERI